MSFAALVGNSAMTSRLATMTKAKRVPPSLLFAGPAGVGKLEAALTIARALNCLVEPGVGCDACPSCTRIGAGEHPDVVIVRPEGAGRQIKAESVRRIVSDAPFRPFEGRHRVSIFFDADRMNPAAANTLLKTLEEPPEWAVLILITTNAAALLPTLVSRCQVYRFAPLATSELADLLVDEHGFDREAAILRAALSGGSLSEALEVADAPLAELRRDALRMASLVASGSSEQELVAWAEQLSKDDELLLRLTMLAGILRDLAAARGGGELIHEDLRSELDQLSAAEPISVWVRAHELAEEALLDLRDRYLNKRLTMSRLLAELSSFARTS